jgi:hypothetical protein
MPLPVDDSSNRIGQFEDITAKYLNRAGLSPIITGK